MKKQFKQTYLSPETESLLVQTEGSVCYVSKDAFIQGVISYDDSTINDNGEF